MTPDQAERVARLEANMAEVQRDQARQGSEIRNLGRELSSLRDLVQSLVPIGERTAVLVEQVSDVKGDVTRVETKFDKRWDRLEASQEISRRDSRSLRNLLIGVGVAAVLSPVGAFLFAAAVAKP